jgi:hypothetical protein
MWSRRKLVQLTSSNPQQFAHRVRAAVVTQYPPEAWPNIRKDLHLVQLALATDRIVISGDIRARNAFAIASTQIRELGPICWVNPIVHGDLLLRWLRGEAEAPRHWNLDPTRESA